MAKAARPGVGGNRRAGLLLGGGLLILLGLGVMIVLNLALHALAMSEGHCINVLGLVLVCHNWYWGATVVAALGAFATLVGAGMITLGAQRPTAPLRLFDTEGRWAPDPEEP